MFTGGGLGKLKNYCSICKKQCKDENGMKLHLRSSYHLKNVANGGSSNDQASAQNSYNFEREFTDLFRYKYGKGKYYPINRIYNELIHDKNHTHLSTTRWKSLNGFARYLRSDIARFNLKWKVLFPQGGQEEEESVSEEEDAEFAGGVDQTMLKLVDDGRPEKDDGRRKQQEVLSHAELEKKREQKDMEKRI